MACVTFREPVSATVGKRMVFTGKGLFCIFHKETEASLIAHLCDTQMTMDLRMKEPCTLILHDSAAFIMHSA